MKNKWWQDTVVYQIYPKSFMDSDNNGVGDIRGIIQKLDYLEWLGVNVLWLCPVNLSPMKDNGYDIADYYKIAPEFGNNEDFEELIAKAGEHGIKILMDLVVNHVSSEHAWFQDMLHNPESPYKDYFIIRTTEDGEIPNNFRSYFGGSVWERIGDTNSFYFHAFAKEQPDLNWENPKLRQEICDMMSYWHKKGIAGFRIDAIGNIKKSEQILSRCRMPADAEDGLADSEAYLLCQPGIGEFLSELREKVFRKYDSMTVAEVNVPDGLLEEFIGENGYFSMVFDFSYADIDVKDVVRPCDFYPWTLGEMKECVFHSQYSTQNVGWAAPYLENHDQPRSVNKYLPDGEINSYSTKMLGALYFFLRGTPYIYQGQEIGMSNFPFRNISQFNDIDAHQKYSAAVKMGESEDKIMDFLSRRSRDNGRTPMQWDTSAYGGFTERNPWLAVNPNYVSCNVEAEEKDEDSVLNFYRRMIELRMRSEYREALVYGEFEGVETEEAEDFIYRRIGKNREVTVVINYSGAERPWKVNWQEYEVLLDNYETIDEEVMKPWQVLILGRMCR